MKSNLIKDTTQSERIALIKSWIPDDDGLEDCGIDLWEMYDDYIKGKREIAEINASFVPDYVMDEEALELQKQEQMIQEERKRAAEAARNRRMRGGKSVQ